MNLYYEGTPLHQFLKYLKRTKGSHKNFYHVYMNLTSVYCILPSVDRATITSAGTSDSCNPYMNCTSKRKNCVLILWIHQMNGCEPPISGRHSSTVGDTAIRPGSKQIFMHPGRVCISRAGTRIMGAGRIHLKFELSF